MLTVTRYAKRSLQGGSCYVWAGIYVWVESEFLRPPKVLASRHTNNGGLPRLLYVLFACLDLCALRWTVRGGKRYRDLTDGGRRRAGPDSAGLR